MIELIIIEICIVAIIGSFRFFKIPKKAKIVIYKDKSWLYVKDGITWEYENEPDWFATINLNRIYD